MSIPRLTYEAIDSPELCLRQRLTPFQVIGVDLSPIQPKLYVHWLLGSHIAPLMSCSLN